MKKTNLLLVNLIITLCVTAQVPQALNYQAVARTSAGLIIPSQSIGVRFTITDAAGATVFYQETHNTVTNNFGLFTLAIGKGTAVSGAIAPIDWSAGGDKFLKVEIAPQGGTNYTMQGMTQLLSVPYALYAEKTKLTGGNAITITNGNTINANYIAGTGITITGNTISATTTTNNSWLLTGNTGTTAANFLGTTDNIALNFRVNNGQRFSISPVTPVGSYNVAYMTAGDISPTSNNPTQLSVHGKDISGFMLPFGVNSSIVGMTWSPTGGANNTLGRLVRWAQWTSNTNNQFYDQGIDQEGDFFITDRGLSGTGGVFPKKMLQISTTNNVGINMDWTENPTANFHTKGTLRFEDITTNNALTRVMVMDNNGNVSSRDASTFAGSNNNWTLIGNAGTTVANFLGTTDNQSLFLRTNNVNRLMIDAGQPVTGGSLSTAFLSDFASIRSAPAQFALYGKDVNGVAIPEHIFSSVEGMNWTPTGGTNNTQGRFLRMTQMTSANYSDGQFFDFGIDQGVSLYISNRGQNSVGGVSPKKMITISPQDFVGVNFDWGQNPTANFHTRGTLRFEGITTNNALTRVVVMDNNGNVSSRDASTFSSANNAWTLLGNAGTTAANFLGTTDNQSLFLRTNNVNRLMIDAGQPVTGGNLSTAFLSDFASIRTAPAQFALYGKDVNGVAIPEHIFSSVEGMNWTPTGGTNNTQGRFLRMTQMTSATYSTGQFFDFGIDQGVSFYISNRGLNSVGGVSPKKMITVSPQDFVGINFDWGQNPTANLHTRGTLRFEGVNTNNALTRIVAMDANGNVASRDASTLNGFWVADANGIHNSNIGHVGIGGLSSNQHALNVEMMDNTIDGRPMAKFTTNDSWQTNLWMYNTSNNASFSLLVGGSSNTLTNYGVGAAGFGIANQINPTTTIPLIITTDNKVGISNSLGGTDNLPKSRLHVRDGDIYIDQISSGVIMKSPNGQCWRMTVSDTGTPIFTAITCP